MIIWLVIEFCFAHFAHSLWQRARLKLRYARSGHFHSARNAPKPRALCHNASVWLGVAWGLSRVCGGPAQCYFCGLGMGLARPSVGLKKRNLSRKIITCCRCHCLFSIKYRSSYDAGSSSTIIPCFSSSLSRNCPNSCSLKLILYNLAV